MQFECPACRHAINANVAKPGKFQPKCPKCGAAILIQITVGLPGDATGKGSAPTKAPVPRPVDPDATYASQPPATPSGPAPPLAWTWAPLAQ